MASPFATPNLNWEYENLSEAFRSFKLYCCLIFDGPFSKKPEKERVTYLLLWFCGLDEEDVTFTTDGVGTTRMKNTASTWYGNDLNCT